jgi:hypothetical protein
MIPPIGTLYPYHNQLFEVFESNAGDFKVNRIFRRPWPHHYGEWAVMHYYEEVPSNWVLLPETVTAENKIRQLETLAWKYLELPK